MIDEQIRDGDFVVVEDRKTADNGEMVIALVGGTDVTLKKFYRDNGREPSQPANPACNRSSWMPRTCRLQGVVVGMMRNAGRFRIDVAAGLRARPAVTAG